jgi:hypothetical protein
MERLRDVLEQSRRATDKVTSIVKHTDAQLLELQELMGPVQERAQSLSNAHKNLTAVRDETRTWLDHLEAINDAETRLDRAFEDEDPDEPTGPDAFLRCVDRVAQAERFFGERRSFEGADAGWRRAGEILGLCLRACEREFQKLVAAQNRDRRDSSRRASVPDGKALRATAETLRRVAPAPPPPFGTDAWDAHVARRGSGADPDASGSAPPAATGGSHHDSRSAEKTPRRLAALARTLLTHSAEARETTKRLYVSARVAALDETLAAFTSPDASAALADASERAHLSLRAAAADNRHCDVSLFFGDGAAYVAEADARVAALAAMTKKWSAEPRVARAAFAFDDLEVSEHEPADLDRLGVDLALCTAPAVVAASAARALAWVDEAAARTDPARAFGLLAARARLTRTRWAMETEETARDAFGSDVFFAWDAATASAERGAKRALEEVGDLIKSATETLKTRIFPKPGVVFVPADFARRAEDAAALTRAAAAFLTNVSERDDARAVLFGVGKSARGSRGSEDEDAAFAAFASASLEAATNVAELYDASFTARGAQTPATTAKKASGKPPAATAAALLAAAADEAVRASGASEAARRAFGEAWPARARAIASARVDAYVSAAWGGALEAMDPEGAPPGSGLTEKQRQAVKDRFTAVNAAVDESAQSGQAEWRFPRPETARALRSATTQAVVAAYAAFYRRYKDSGFTRKHPEKYIKHSPEALGEIVQGLFAGYASD